MKKDQIIILGIIKGDPNVLTDFYRDNIRYVQGYILRNLGNTEDVEDVFQDALVVLYEKLKAGFLTIKGPLKTYFYGICKNIWRSQLRKEQKLQIVDTSDIDFYQEASKSIYTDIEIKEKEHLYKKYFVTLSTSNKKVLHLSFDGKSEKEIAHLTGYTLGYTRKKKFEAKKKLRALIQKDPVYKELIMI